MRFPFENIAEVLRLSKVEKWTRRAIARHFGVHPSTIQRVLESNGVQSKLVQKSKNNIFDKYESFVLEVLEKYPNICTTAIFRMVQERGYPGVSISFFRKQVGRIRPAKRKEAFLRLETLPGEEAQADWAHFGKIKVGNLEHKLWAFVMVLSHSRMMFVKFSYNCKMMFFLDGFQEAFEYFGGVPKKVLIDNLKTGVSQRIGNCIQYNAEFKDFCRHSLFEPRAVGVRKGNEKGKVERKIRFLRENFFAGRSLTTLEKLNEEVLNWCSHFASKRHVESLGNQLVSDLFIAEKPLLSALPQTRFVTAERGFLSVSKYCFVRFENNHYSVPEHLSQKEVEYEATATQLHLFYGQDTLVFHERCWEKGKYILIAEHHAKILKSKKKAVTSAGMARLVSAVPEAEKFLQELAQRGESLSGAVSSLLDMLVSRGEKSLQLALQEVLTNPIPRLATLHFILKRNCQESESQPLPRIHNLPTKFANIHVAPHDLGAYDRASGNVQAIKDN